MASLATWFTPSLQTISRSSGRSAVLAAAYRACAKLTDERLGITQDYTPKGKHGLAGNICIGIPNDDIGALWNNAEKAESRANSTVARELMIPLSADWDDNERRECVRDIAQHLRDTYGVAVLASVHYPAKDNNNHHAHIIFTTRAVDADGVFGKKTRILDDLKTGEVKRMREAVCELVNTHARANGNDWYVYSGKFSDIIVDHIPTNHISIKAGKNQRPYIEANRAEVGVAMVALKESNNRISAIDAELLSLQREPEDANDALLREVDRLNTPIAPSMEATESKPAAAALKRLAMPADAIKAKEQIEKALFSKQMLRQQFYAWDEMHTQLLGAVPAPEYGFFGRPTAKYKKALAEHTESVQAAKTGMDDCTEKATKLIEYIQEPARKKLYQVYKATIDHNAQVDAHELQLAQEREKESARLAQEKMQREQSANRVDWSAYLREGEREREERRMRDASSGYGGEGYGL